MRAGVVLSGGGARCFAQIGALAAFDERGIEVAAIAANSTAAILAAIYAKGCSAREVRDIVAGADYARFLQLRGRGGLLSNEGVADFVRQQVPASFEELRIPLVVPTVDIQNAELIVFSSGPLVAPVCASNAFPGLFEPVEIEGRFLVDGGIIDNLPVDLIRPLFAGPIAAIDVRMSPLQRLDLEGSEGGFWERLRSGFSPATPLVVEVLMKAYTITQSRLIEILLAAHPPDLTIAPPLGDDFALQDFGRLDEAFELGYEAARAQLQQAGW